MITMKTIGEALGLIVDELSDQNYAQSLEFYRFWLNTGRTYTQIPSDQIFYAVWNNRAARGSIDPNSDGQVIHQNAHLTLRFAGDAESDHVPAPYNSRLRNRLSRRSLQEISNNSLMAARYGQNTVVEFYADANLVAHWANLCQDI